MRTSLRRYTGLSLAVSIGVIVSMITPTFAASPRAHSASSVHKAAGKSTKCTHQNKASGTIKYSDWEFPDDLNPYQTNASVSFETIASMVEFPILLSPKPAALPDLFASLPKVENGGRTYVATMRKGLRWSNGQPITAADVKFGWELGMNPSSGPYCPGIGCDVITRIDTHGKYGLVFHLKTVYAPFVLNVLPSLPVWPTSWPGAWAKGDVAAATKKLWTDATFNFEGPSFPTDGAYQVTSFVANDRIELRPMKYYRTLSCGGKVATLIFDFFASKPGLIAAAASGQTDTTTDYTAADLPQLTAHTGAYKTDIVPSFEVEHLVFNREATYKGKPNPLHDTRVRLALALALDKIGLIESSLGVSRKIAVQLEAWTPLAIFPGKFTAPYADTALKGQWDPIARKYQLNTGHGQALADAKKLLAQAGYPNGFSIDGVTTTGNPTRQAEFGVMQANWLKIGVHYNPGYIPASVLFGDYAQGAPPHTGDFQIAMWTDVELPDPDSWRTTSMSQFVDWQHATHSAINGNAGDIQDPLIDEAFKKGATTLNAKTRKRWYDLWQVQMNKQAYWVELYYRFEITTDDGHIGVFKPSWAGEEWNTFAWYPKGKS